MYARWSRRVVPLWLIAASTCSAIQWRISDLAEKGAGVALCPREISRVVFRKGGSQRASAPRMQTGSLVYARVEELNRLARPSCYPHASVRHSSDPPLSVRADVCPKIISALRTSRDSQASRTYPINRPIIARPRGTALEATRSSQDHCKRWSSVILTDLRHSEHSKPLGATHRVSPALSAPGTHMAVAIYAPAHPL